MSDLWIGQFGHRITFVTWSTYLFYTYKQSAREQFSFEPKHSDVITNHYLIMSLSHLFVLDIKTLLHDQQECESFQNLSFFDANFIITTVKNKYNNSLINIHYSFQHFRMKMNTLLKWIRLVLNVSIQHSRNNLSIDYFVEFHTISYRQLALIIHLILWRDKFFRFTI